MQEYCSDMNSQFFQKIDRATELYRRNREHLNKTKAECEKLKELYAEKSDDFKFLLREFDLNIRMNTTGIDDRRRTLTFDEEKLISEECLKKNVDRKSICNLFYDDDSIHGNNDIAIMDKPCLSVIGQTNSGKSSLINRLVNDYVVPQSERRLTGRVTYITFSEKNYVAFFNPQSKLEKLRICTDKIDLESDEIDLNSEDRNDQTKVNVQIKLGMNNDLLKNGIDIVDSPGLNENSTLNKLCSDMTKNLLPLIVYVIDGRDGLKESDIRDIKNIKFETPELHIIYFVSKLDQTEFDRRRNKSANPISVAQRRLKNVFDKLKLCGFIAEAESIEACKTVHGCDLWTLEDLQNSNRDTLSAYEKYCLSNFKKFEEDLVDFVCNRLERHIRSETEHVRIAIEQLLEKVMEKAWIIVNSKRQKLQDIEEYREKENSLFEKEFASLKQSLKDEIRQMVTDKETRFLESLRLLNEQLLSNKSLDSLQKLHDEIKRSLEVPINTEVKYKIMDFMNSKELSLRNSLKELVDSLSTGPYGLTSFQTMLQNRLFHEYNCDTILENCFKPLKNCLSYKILENFSQLPHHSEYSENIFETECKRIIDTIDKETFVENVYRTVFDQFDKNHELFVMSLDGQKEALERHFKELDSFRFDLKKMAEEFAFQFMNCLHITTPYKLKISSSQDKDYIGKGGQAKVYKLKLLDNTDIVEKQYEKPIRQYSEFDITKEYCPFIMEVYYSSRLNHQRVLPLLGLSLTTVGQEHHLSTYSPFMSEGDCARYLKVCSSKSIITQEQKLNLAVQIAEGIDHIHSLKIIHRDVALKNIFIQKNKMTSEPEAVVADYGLSKSFGFVDSSDRYFGTPVYMAPEIICNSADYTEKVDVYSYGIVLWQLMTYTNDEHLYPKFIRKFSSRLKLVDSDICRSLIERKIADGERPEITDEIHPDIQNLIVGCWNGDANKRPTFEDIIVRLRNVKDKICM